MSPWTLNKVPGNEVSCIVMPQNSYPQNYVPMNQQNIDNPQTLAPKNKYDSIVIETWYDLQLDLR